MANIETQNTLPLGAISTYRIVNIFDTAIANLRTWNAARRTTNELNKLSDAQLADIGITRGDIYNVSREYTFR